VKNTLFIALLLCVYLPNTRAQNWEMRYLRHLESKRTPTKTKIMLGLSHTVPAIPIATPASLFVTSLVNKDMRLRQISITGTIGLAVIVAETYALKALIKRPRPYVKYPDFTASSSEKTYSMPSGHTSTAFYTATWLTLEYPKWYIAAPSFLWAGMVAHSRNQLGVHYPTDILVGAALGSLTAWGVWKLRN
jgi:membrane-associated phospholipid phosphatase